MQSATGDCSGFAAKSDDPSGNYRSSHPYKAAPATASDGQPSVQPKRRKSRMKFTPRRSFEEKQLLWPHAPVATVDAAPVVKSNDVHMNEKATESEKQRPTEPTGASLLQLSTQESNEVNHQLTIRHVDLLKKFTTKVKLFLTSVSRLEKEETVTSEFYQLLLTAVQLVVDMGRHVFSFESIPGYTSALKRFKIESRRVTNAFEAAQSNDILGSTLAPSLEKATGIIGKMGEIYEGAVKVGQLLNRTVVAEGTGTLTSAKSHLVSDQQISTCTTSGKPLLPHSVAARPGNSPPLVDSCHKVQSPSGVVYKKQRSESSQTSNCATSVSSNACVTQQIPLPSGSAVPNHFRFEVPGAPQYAIRVPTPAFPYTVVPHQMHLATYGGSSYGSLGLQPQPPSQGIPNAPPPNLMSPMFHTPNSGGSVPEKQIFFGNFQSNVFPLHMARHPHASSGFITQGVFHSSASPTGSSKSSHLRAESLSAGLVSNSNADAPGIAETHLQSLPGGVSPTVSAESQFEGVLPPSPEPTPDSVKDAEESAYDRADETWSRFNYTVQSESVDPDCNGPYESSALPEDKRRSVEEVDSTGGAQQRPDSPLTSPRLNDEFRRLLSARNSTEDRENKGTHNDSSKDSDEDPPLKKKRSKKSKKGKHREKENDLKSACRQDDVQTSDSANNPTERVENSDVLSLNIIKAHRGLFHCKGCISKIEKADFFADFAFIHGRLGFPCPHCAFIGHSGTVLKSHVENSHTAIAEHRCVFCEKSYDLDAFCKHAEIVERQRFCCPKCSFCSSERSEYSTHYKTEHSSDGPAPVINGTADFINIPSCVSSSRQIHQCFNTCIVDNNCQILQVLVNLQPDVERAESEKTEAADADDMDVKPHVSQLSVCADKELSIAKDIVRKMNMEEENCSEGSDQEQDEPLRKKRKLTHSDVSVTSIAAELVNKFRGIVALGGPCLLSKSTGNTVVDLTSDMEDSYEPKEPNASDNREQALAVKESADVQRADQEERLATCDQASAEGKKRKIPTKKTPESSAVSKPSVDDSKSRLSQKPGPKFTKVHGAGAKSKRTNSNKRGTPLDAQNISKASVDDSKSRLSQKPGPKFTKVHRAGAECKETSSNKQGTCIDAENVSKTSVDDSKSRLSQKPGPKFTKLHRAGGESAETSSNQQGTCLDADSTSKLSRKPGPKFTKVHRAGEESKETSCETQKASVDAENLAEKASRSRAVKNFSLKDVPPDVTLRCQHKGCKYEGKKLRMMYHLVESHSYVKNYKCSSCKEDFATSSSVISHISENAGCAFEKARPKMERPFDELCDKILYAKEKDYRLFVKGYYFKL